MLFRWATVLLVLLSSVASAEEDAVEARARARFTAGVALYEAGELVDALKNFEEAYRLSHLSPFLYNIAVCEERLGHLQRALDGFERYLAEAPTFENRPQIEDRMRALRARLSAESQIISSPAPARRPLYKRAWLWAVVGGTVAVGVGVGVCVALGRSHSGPEFSTKLPTGGPGAR